VTNQNNAPAIYSIGNVPWTFQYASRRPPALFATGGLPTENLARNQGPIGRNVFVQTRLDPLFAVAMAAITTVDLHGKNVSTDSFDSADPNHSSSGFYPYWQLWKTKDNGHVVTDGVVTDTMDLGNAKIKGFVKTGPGVNTIEIGPGGSVGDKDYVDTGKTGIQSPPPHSATDFNVVFPDVQLPDTTWLPLGQTNVTINGTNYQYVITQGGDYRISSDLNQSVYIDAPAGAVVRIRVSNNVSLSGDELINITPTGAQVLMYMEGNSFSLTGQAAINNQSGFARNFYLFGLPTCRSINFMGNGMFTGAVYAPSAAFVLGGGGSDVWDFVGASVTKSVVMNGHFRFHYDEDLGKIGPSKGYVPVNWKEV
jgi:hypothetical protein